MISISTLHSFWLRLLARLALLLAFGAFAASAGAQTTITFFHNDILGSPAIATDADGAVVWKENYLPYGHRLQAPAAGANNKLWFAGKPYDQTNWITYIGGALLHPPDRAFYQR
ncbi:RHS domain-containing protein [Acidovorax sp. Root267]|uniref:RHS domain-containing protein n=1 Tax=Acidovorax sp. Root267 TaxID=1736505 RepID=UPI001F5BC80F|nr:RHS domain-containing protein [Acidovorax sp. Root267]